MSEEVTITFYKIYKCGFYKKNKNQFGSVKELLPDLKKWATSVKRMLDTQLFDNNKSDSADSIETDIRTVFYYDLCNSKGSSLLVLWNQLLDIDREVPTISKDKEIGDSIKCKITELPENAIPGTSSYFWFLPDEGYFATITRKDRTSNVAGMKLYLEKFLAWRSSYCVIDPNSKEEIKVLGYKKVSDSKYEQGIEPYFQAKRATQTGQIEYIQSNRTKIRKVIRKQQLIKNHKPRYNVIQQLLIGIGVRSPNIENKNIRTTYEVSYTPTEKELKDIISNWEKAGITTFDDTGFVLSGEPGRKHWLSGEISRIKKEWALKYIDAEIIDPHVLLDLLNENKQELLQVLP